MKNNKAFKRCIGGIINNFSGELIDEKEFLVATLMQIRYGKKKYLTVGLENRKNSHGEYYFDIHVVELNQIGDLEITPYIVSTMCEKADSIDEAIRAFNSTMLSFPQYIVDYTNYNGDLVEFQIPECIASI